MAKGRATHPVKNPESTVGTIFTATYGEKAESLKDITRRWKGPYTSEEELKSWTGKVSRELNKEEAGNWFNIEKVRNRKGVYAKVDPLLETIESKLTNGTELSDSEEKELVTFLDTSFREYCGKMLRIEEDDCRTSLLAQGPYGVLKELIKAWTVLDKETVVTNPRTGQEYYVPHSDFAPLLGNSGSSDIENEVRERLAIEESFGVGEDTVKKDAEIMAEMYGAFLSLSPGLKEKLYRLEEVQKFGRTFNTLKKQVQAYKEILEQKIRAER